MIDLDKNNHEQQLIHSRNKKISSGIKLIKKADRHNVFQIQQFKNDHGFYLYALENTAEGKTIFIQRHIFSRFRACISHILKNDFSRRKRTFEYNVDFLNKNYFYLKSSNMDLDNLIIQDIEERTGSSGYITVSRNSLAVLEKLLYSEKLQHPNDVFEVIISYHKLFQFSFVKGSKSITSNLALRKDILYGVEKYNPNLAERIVLIENNEKQSKKTTSKSNLEHSEVKLKKQKNQYQPKLGERFSEKNITVDYETLFADGKYSLETSSASADEQTDKRTKRQKMFFDFPIPLSSTDLKSFNNGKFFFELTTQDSSLFRERFIGDRSCEFYLGFEMVNALFSFNKTIKTFRFPLYYCKVVIRESGRGVHLEIKDDGRFYLNHLALSHLVDKFTDSSAKIDRVDVFFKTLLAQDISIDRVNDRIHLVRHLPVKEAIFDRTREILFGYQDENGKGGILAELELKGIECDLHSTVLYRAAKIQNPIDQAFETDLDKINLIAHHSTKRFYNSLLGRFLTPELKADDKEQDQFAPLIWMPGSLPKSSRNLVSQLNQHDLVLLEGPPGTGKTHTIMNLLIHSINTKQRVLIVSDQPAAIEALVEKLLGYLAGGEYDQVNQRQWKDLLFSAIKIIDDVDTNEQTMTDLVNKLSKVFKVQESNTNLIVDSGVKDHLLEKKFKLLKQKIAKLTNDLTLQLMAHVGEDVAFDIRVPKKNEDPDSFHNIEGLINFVELLLDKKTKHRKIIDCFIKNRFELINQKMQSCYGFFKIPSINIESELKRLADDAKILKVMLQQKPETTQSFDDLVKDYPRHEVIRYLETVLSTRLSQQGQGLFSFFYKIQSLFYSPLRSKTALLLSMIEDQIKLLKTVVDLPENIVKQLQQIHETIRLGEASCQALGLYQRINKKLNKRERTQSEINSSQLNFSSSIQGLLEEINDLYQQQDKMVKQGFIRNLNDIVRGATISSQQKGTNKITSVMALLDNLKQFNSIHESGGVFEELTEKLFDTFPIWIVRKQMVPFLLPCAEQSFDLVVIDEATQCRVDDAISLMYRAKKMLVVGDDKQTVLQKNSVIDDYLFKDHELDEHLRSTQARGFKGGGSHIFGLVKSIKQASVMLDEHYRCPAEIIEFSNKYVYDNELKIMQWSLPELPPSVIVDYSERKTEPSKKPTSGKFKGIETKMFDRYFDYVAKTIKQIENKTGKKINTETDVALCYFLLKNEPYVTAVKSTFLNKLDRGEFILDGAGAALQGKERDYMFYFWDITRYNIGAFKQGDSSDKRKGELNVLMSRPKKKAFHFLHRNFEELEHSRTNITDYLWRSYYRQTKNKKFNQTPLVDSSSSLVKGLLELALKKSSKRGLKEIHQILEQDKLDFRDNIAVGDAQRIVDLIAFPQANVNKTIGIIDLSGFGNEENIGESIVDYFFQLKRAVPKIDPVFAFPYELADENSQSFQSLIEKLETLL